jgi:hypothetical protein
MKIKIASGTFLQPLDYEGIPFKFHRFHAYGHGVANCKLPFKGKFHGLLDVGTSPGLGRMGQDYGVTRGNMVGISQEGDSGRVNRRQSTPSVGPSSVDRDPTLTKDHKSSL